MSEVLQPWIILAISESRANASWRSAHFGGGRALSGDCEVRSGARHHACTHGTSELKAKDCLCSCPWLCVWTLSSTGFELVPKEAARAQRPQSGWVASPFRPYSFCSRRNFSVSACISGVESLIKSAQGWGRGGWGGGVWKLSLSQCRFIADLFSTPMEGWLQSQVADSRLSGGIRNITCMLKHRRSKSDKFYWDENNEFNLLQNNGSFSRGKKKPWHLLH